MFTVILWGGLFVFIVYFHAVVFQKNRQARKIAFGRQWAWKNIGTAFEE